MTMHTDGVHISPSGKKFFIPLENNPDVFTSLVHDLGLSPDVGFYDVYNIDEEELLALIPRPAYALIFITPAEMYFASRREDAIATEVNELTYDKAGADEPIMWFKQTIGNACGLIALIHSIANGPARSCITKGSLIDRLVAEGESLKPEARADLLYASEPLEQAHMRAANRGNTAAPPAERIPNYHFIAFVKGKDQHLYELEGATDGPVDRGYIGASDVLSKVALEQGVRKFLKHSQGNLNFSLVALAKSAESAEMGSSTA